jgi:long-subunit fatty acid transport protein
MKKSLRVVFYLILCLNLTKNTANAATGASFLDIGTSARAISLGGAYVSAANDITAINYNPAGLAHLKSNEIMGQHTQWIGGISHDFMAVAMPTHIGTVGLSIIYLSQGRIEGRDENRNKTASFRAFDVAAKFSYSRPVNDELKFGGNFKIIEQSIADETATGAGIDFGLLYSPSSIFSALPDGLTFGMSIQNLGSRMKFISESYNLPLTATVGVGYNLLNAATIALDVKRKINDKKTEISFGTEYTPITPLAVRVGYLKSVNGESAISISKIKGMSGGVGIKVLKFSTDYAFTPYGDLGNAHRISFSTKF